MRVATYTQRTAASRGSIFALAVLIMTILLGTGVVPTIAVYMGGPFERLLTPLWVLLYVGSLLGLMFNHGINWISWLVRYRILLVLLLLGTILSVSWSIDARVSAERTVHLVGSVLVAVYIGFTVPLLTTLRVFAVVLALMILASIAAVLALPALGLESYEGLQVWRGVFNSKNDLGFWAAIGVLLYITLSDSTQATYRKILCFIMAGLSLGLLGLSQSATSLLAMLLAGSLSLYLYIASRFQLGFVRMAIIAILFTAVVALGIANINTAELVGRTGDLTGRGEVWRQVWKLIMQYPLTGVGYGSLWFPTDDTIWIQQTYFEFTWVVYHAHNALLHVASEIGLPLTLIALLMVAQQLIEIFYCQYERQQVGVLFVLAFVTAYLVSNYSEARFLVTRELFWIFFLALPISMLRQINVISLDSDREGSDEYDNHRDSAGHYRQPYGAIPGKPWLDPHVHKQIRGRRAEAASVGASEGTARGSRPGTNTAATGVAALVTYQPDADASQGRIVYGGETPEALGIDDEQSSHTELQLDETDIDLGIQDDLDAPAGVHVKTDINLGRQEESSVKSRKAAPGKQFRDLPDDLDSTQDLTDSEDLTHSDELEALQEDISDLRAPIEHDSIHYDDSLEVDKYDKELDMSTEWIDIDLADGEDHAEDFDDDLDDKR